MQWRVPSRVGSTMVVDVLKHYVLLHYVWFKSHTDEDATESNLETYALRVWDMNPSLLPPVMSKIIMQLGLSTLAKTTGLEKGKTWRVSFKESVVDWCTILLLSAHLKSVAGSTQFFITINKSPV